MATSDYKGVLHHGHWRAGLVRRHGPSIKQESCRLLSPFGEKQQPGQHERTQSCKLQTVGMCDTSDFQKDHSLLNGWGKAGQFVFILCIIILSVFFVKQPTQYI